MTYRLMEGKDCERCGGEGERPRTGTCFHCQGTGTRWWPTNKMIEPIWDMTASPGSPQSYMIVEPT